MTLEKYFALDDASDVKLESCAGQVYAMAGALRPQNLVAGNVFASLHQQMRGRPCEVYQRDQRVRAADGLFTYPDLSVACEPRSLEESELTLLNAALIVEVLSESTEAFDRDGKFESYQTIESLKNSCSSLRITCMSTFSRGKAMGAGYLPPQVSWKMLSSFPHVIAD